MTSNIPIPESRWARMCRPTARRSVACPCLESDSSGPPPQCQKMERELSLDFRGIRLDYWEYAEYAQWCRGFRAAEAPQWP
jgi:hypothetical protein